MKRVDRYIADFEGGRRIEEFLKEHNPKIKKWDFPKPASDVPEAEWGFVDELKTDIMQQAKANSWNVCSVTYTHPDDLSPFTAELYRWWYQLRQIDPSRILIECFALLDPWWALLTGSVPYLLAFNTKPSKDTLSDYIEQYGHFKESYLMLMSKTPNSPEIEY